MTELTTDAQRLLDEHAALRAQLAAKDEQWAKTNAQYESAAKAVTRLTTELAALRAQLAAMTKERDVLKALNETQRLSIKGYQQELEAKP